MFCSVIENKHSQFASLEFYDLSSQLVGIFCWVSRECACKFDLILLEPQSKSIGVNNIIYVIVRATSIDESQNSSDIYDILRSTIYSNNNDMHYICHPVI